MIMANSRIQLLRDMPVFGAIREDTLTFLLAAAPVVNVAKGAYFFREGDKAPSMFVLEAGSVAVLKRWRDRQYPLTVLGKGDCFGEMALIGLFPRTATVKATDDCVALELSAAALFDLYERDLEQFALIQMNIARELSRRLRIADERLFRVLAETESVDHGVTIST
jgi:CRP/FNR family cyclic AMP-dependent transcriptional regulator